MYKLLIKVSNQQKQIFTFGTSITIGREDSCDLQLMDPSISRNHAQIHIVGDEVIAEDLGSQNGIVVDGQRLRANQRLPMRSNSEIQLGKFTLVLLLDNFYRGRSISYLAEYDPNTLIEPQADEETLQLSARQATQMLREQNLLNNACIIDENGNKVFPETNTITFGSAGTIKAKGMFTGKIAAEISWNGSAHVLTKKGGFLCTVKINDVGISEQQLTVGNRIQIGNSLFEYVLHSDR